MNRNNIKNKPTVYRTPLELTPRNILTQDKSLRSGLPPGVESRGAPGWIDRSYIPPGYNNALLIRRAFQGRVISVGTTPTRIIKATVTQPYIILNPNLILPETSFGTHVTGIKTVTGNSQSSPLNIANYASLHLFLDITAVAGTSPTIDITLQSQSPSSNKWVDIQDVWVGLNAVGSFYDFTDAMGIAKKIAFKWTIGGTNPSFTFTLEYVLKGGLPGTSGGLSSSISLGDSGVSTVSGYPLLHESRELFIIKEGVELFGIANDTLNINIFEL